jgi:hypothetical protein
VIVVATPSKRLIGINLRQPHRAGLLALLLSFDALPLHVGVEDTGERGWRGRRPAQPGVLARIGGMVERPVLTRRRVLGEAVRAVDNASQV